MANFEIPETPVYSEAMRKLEDTDQATAELFNGMFLRLLENDAALRNTTLIFNDVSVDASAWVDDGTYEGYPYRVDIPCEGVTADHVADVMFNITEAMSGNYAPVCVTGDGIVSIYCTEIPSETIVIPTLKCTKAVSA